MTFLLSLLSIGKNVMGWLTAGVKYLFAAWYRIALAVALAAFLWAYMGWTAADKRAVKWKRTAEVEMSLRIANEVAYKDAQKVAADLNKKQVESIKSQYAAIAEKSEIDYEKRLAANKLAINNWLRSRTIEGITSRPRTGPASEVQSETSGTEAMPVIPRGFVIVPESDLDKTADIQATLAALQEAARAIEKSGNTTSANRD